MKEMVICIGIATIALSAVVAILFFIQALLT